MPVKKKTTPTRRRRTTTKAAPTRRRRTVGMASKTRQKAFLMNAFKALAGGAGAKYVESLGDQIGVPGQYSSWLPLVAAYFAEVQFKQPALAHGMIGASASQLLGSFGLADQGQTMLPEKNSFTPIESVNAEPLDLQDYAYPGLSDWGNTNVYASNY